MGSAAITGIPPGVATLPDKELDELLAQLDPKTHSKLTSALSSLEECETNTTLGSEYSRDYEDDDDDGVQTPEVTRGTYCDWGSPDLAGLVTSPETPITAPLVILEPWEDVGSMELAGVRASCSMAVLARRIGLEAQMIPLWDLGTKIGVEKLAQDLVGKTLVFEGGEPSVYDAASFSHENCPRTFLIELYKRVLRMRHQTGPGTFICLSHQLVLAALIELIKDAVRILCNSGDEMAYSVGQEVHDVGMNVQITKGREKGEVVETICVGYETINEKGLDLFATCPNGCMEAELQELLHFDPTRFDDRPDLKPFLDVHGQEAPHCEMKREIVEDEDGVFIAMFHADEINVEAALFANWALRRIASVVEHMAPDAKQWLGNMPVSLEIVGSTVDIETREMCTEVASMRIDYKIGEAYESYYTCQFHPELDEQLADSRTHSPPCCDVEDGARLVHSLLRAQNIPK